MGLREFQDHGGVRWKVWSVTPDSLDKRTTAEDYMRDWQDGWLCFECGDSRRRLANYPANWEELADEELEKLLDRAVVVKRRRPEETTGEFREVIEGGAPAPPLEVERAQSGSTRDAGRITPSEGVDTARSRSFTDHRGRTFTAALYRLPPQRGSERDEKVASSPGTVLRFVSGSLVLDLAEWPDDWERYTPRQLTELLGRAQPADAEAIRDSVPIRRRTDLPS